MLSDRNIDKAPIVKVNNTTLQLSQAAWNKLSDELKGRIRNPQTPNEVALAGIVGITLNKVVNFRVPYVNDAVQRVLNYPGRPSLLQLVFDRCGTYDPIAAGKNLDVHCIPVSSVPETMREELAESNAEAPQEIDLKRYTVRSDAGGVLVDSPHVLLLKDDPSKIVAIGGRRLMASHGVTLFGNTPEVTAKRRSAASRIASDSILTALQDVSLKELLQSEELSNIATRSPILARNLAAFNELVPLVQEWHGAIQNAMFGAGFRRDQVDCFHLKTDSGGELLRWCEAHEAAMPEALRLDLSRLLYSPDEIPLQEQHRIVGRLATYRLSQSTINLDVVLSPIQEDLEAFNTLPKTDPLFSAELAASAASTIATIHRSVPADTANEIPLDRLPTLLHAPIVQFRKAMNIRLLNEYREEFFQAIDAFRPIFCSGEHLKESFRDEGIPVNELKSTLYGAEVGQRVFEGSSNPGKRFSALSRDDFYYLREAMYYLSVSPDPERFCSRLSIPRFRKLVCGVITAHRKAINLDEQYTAWLSGSTTVGAPDGPEPGKHVVESIIAHSLTGWTPVVVLGSKIEPHEEFAHRYGISLTHCLQVMDFRYTSSEGRVGEWSKHAAECRFLNQSKLFNFGLPTDLLLHIAKCGKDYLPAPSCTDLAAEVRPFIGNPFIRPALLFQFEDLVKPFVSIRHVEEALKLRAIFADREIKASVSRKFSPDQIEQFVRYRETKFLVGEVVTAHNRHQLQVQLLSGADLLGTPQSKTLSFEKIHGGSKNFKVEWHDAGAALQMCERYRKNSLPADQLGKNSEVVKIASQGPVKRLNSTQVLLGVTSDTVYYQSFSTLLRLITSKEALPSMEALGFIESDSRSKAVIKELPHPIALLTQSFRISTQLISAAVRIYTQSTPPQDESLDGPVQSDGWFTFEGGALLVASGNRHRYKQVVDVLREDPTYITRFIRTRGEEASGVVGIIETIVATEKDRKEKLTLDERRRILNQKFRDALRKRDTGKSYQ